MNFDSVNNVLRNVLGAEVFSKAVETRAASSGASTVDQYVEVVRSIVGVNVLNHNAINFVKAELAKVKPEVKVETKAATK